MIRSIIIAISALIKLLGSRNTNSPFNDKSIDSTVYRINGLIDEATGNVTRLNKWNTTNTIPKIQFKEIPSKLYGAKIGYTAIKMPAHIVINEHFFDRTISCFF